jgi:HlyD family secretion protein
MIRKFTTLSLMAAMALAACHKAPPPTRSEAASARSVRVIEVGAHTLAGGLAASGDLVSREEAAVAPEVSGYRVAAVLADVGQTVKKGQVLVQLDPSLIESQIAQAKANSDQAANQAQRVADLDNSGVLPEEQIQQRRFQAKASAAALQDLMTRRAKMEVRAPVGGLILTKTVRPGDLSSAASTTPWFTMARDSEIELQAQMSENDISKVRVGEKVQVSLPDGQTAEGAVRLVSPQIDPQSKLGYVRVRLPVRPDIRAGGFARAVFEGGGVAVPAVPESAVTYDADGASVMTVDANNRVHKALVVAGNRGGGYVQLLKGPVPGTKVIKAAGSLLLDGDLVRPVEDAQ